ncbi:hypothetical protein ABVK25_005308 [Lepraria finkii]|uniref:C2H2-type domain-containing protein n=1 Tax=Lepraria finkii TaxID=1340010 RepID=A0ABR4B9R2_9LECA
MFDEEYESATTRYGGSSQSLWLNNFYTNSLASRIPSNIYIKNLYINNCNCSTSVTCGNCNETFSSQAAKDQHDRDYPKTCSQHYQFFCLLE